MVLWQHQGAQEAPQIGGDVLGVAWQHMQVVFAMDLYPQLSLIISNTVAHDVHEKIWEDGMQGP